MDQCGTLCRIRLLVSSSKKELNWGRWEIRDTKVYRVMDAVDAGFPGTRRSRRVSAPREAIFGALEGRDCGQVSLFRLPDWQGGVSRQNIRLEMERSSLPNANTMHHGVFR